MGDETATALPGASFAQLHDEVGQGLTVAHQGELQGLAAGDLGVADVALDGELEAVAAERGEELVAVDVAEM